MKELWKSVIIWGSYGQEFGVLFFIDSRCTYQKYQQLKHTEKTILCAGYTASPRSYRPVICICKPIWQIGGSVFVSIARRTTDLRHFLVVERCGLVCLIHCRMQHFCSNNLVTLEPSLCWWHDPVGHFGGRTTGVGGSPRPSQPQIGLQPAHQRRQDQRNGERRHSVPHTLSKWTTGADGYVPVPWVPDYRRWWVYDGIPYQVKQRAGDRGITAENMEKSQHTDFNEDTTNESASVACSNIRRWKLNSEKEWTNTSWRLWDERTENDSAGFVDSKENKWVGS